MERSALLPGIQTENTPAGPNYSEVRGGAAATAVSVMGPFQAPKYPPFCLAYAEKKKTFQKKKVPKIRDPYIIHLNIAL